MSMSKKDMIAKAKALSEGNELAAELADGMSMEQTAAELTDTLEAILDVIETPEAAPEGPEDLADLGYGPIWKVGQGQTYINVIARNQGDALSKAGERLPILLAIGMVATPVEDVEGFPVVALIPEDYQF